MNNMRPKAPKLRSKLERLRIRDDIAEFLKRLPLKDMVENQVGNHVYSSSGKIRAGSFYVPVVIRVRMVDGETVLILTAPKAEVSVQCTFDPKEAAKIVNTALEISLN